MNRGPNRRIIASVVVLGAVALAIGLRWQAGEKIQAGWLDPDIYRIVRQAQIIADEGRLPDSDAMRWVPEGRDLTRQLSLTSYCIAGICRAARPIVRSVTVEDAAWIYPLLCLAVTMPLVFGVVRRLFEDDIAAAVSVVLLAVIPTAYPRSTPGYADRDALCLLLSSAMFYAFLRAMGASDGRRRLAWGVVTGLAQGLLNLTWEGSGLFAGVVAATLIVGSLSRPDDAAGPAIWLGWAPMHTLCLAAAPTYYTVAPFALLAWIAPAYAGLFVIGAYLAARGGRQGASPAPGAPVPIARIVQSIVAAAPIALIVVALLVADARTALSGVWANVTSPLGTSPLMQSLGELRAPSLERWVQWYGFSLLAAAVGTTLCVARLAQNARMTTLDAATVWLLIGAMILYSGAVPDRGSVLSTAPLAIAIACLVVGTAFVCWRGSGSASLQSESQLWFGLIWFTSMLIVARGAERYHFFLAPAFCAFFGHGIVAMIRAAHERLKRPFLRVSATALVAAVVAFVALDNAHGSLNWFREWRPTPTVKWRQAMEWMRENLAPGSVTAAWWDYGSELNYLARQATVIDEDHYAPPSARSRIRGAARHLFSAQTDEEAVGFLQTYGADYLAISRRDLALLNVISNIGADESADRRVEYVVPFRQTDGPAPLEDGSEVIALGPILAGAKHNDGEVSRIFGFAHAVFRRDGTTLTPVSAAITAFENSGFDGARFPSRFRVGDAEIAQEDADLEGLLALFPPTSPDDDWMAYFVQGRATNHFAVRLMLDPESSPFLKPVYPVEHCHMPDVGIWEFVQSPFE